MRISLILGFALVCASSFAANDFYRQQTLERIRPIGQVRVQEDQASKEEKALASIKKEEKAAPKDVGAEIYGQYCKTCHQTGLAGAPIFRDKAKWQPRIDEKGMDKLVANAMKGINAMPPKGTCTKCTEEDIRKAVEYMVPQS